eukprot:TRINITY_DN22486_c0_g1_i1.p1 TRINITY_DN22486_c0_g1~~TRINITY_DN22486_c0_g1_i1.p1  ORF type:complete len:690 (+),score=202.34 TRINITY_DN22486_c0_g1_i1:169-2238(+)
MARVLLESVQVARHIGKLGMRPLEKVAVAAAKATEEVTFMTLRVPVVEALVGKAQVDHLVDNYLQAKDLVGKSVVSVSGESIKQVAQQGCNLATKGARAMGFQVRVLGPLDEHWNSVKVLKHLREECNADDEDGLTPKRFIQFMREAEKKRKRLVGRDPIEGYVDWMLSSGSLHRVGPMALEKKLYTDVARMVCFGFDRLATEVNGVDVWGHQIHIDVQAEDAGTGRDAHRSHVNQLQVEAVVDRMLKAKELQVPSPLRGLQRQLLVNCSLMILRLFEELTSDRHMQMAMLGHSLKIRLEPMALNRLLEQAVKAEDVSLRCGRVNDDAINELVEGLISEPEVQLVFVPDILEAEVYRYVLHRTICVWQFIVSQLRVRLFGIELKMTLIADKDYQQEINGCFPGSTINEVHVCSEKLETLIDRLEEELENVTKELHSRQDSSVMEASATQARAAVDPKAPPIESEFAALAAQDRLARSLSIQRTINVPIELAYGMVANFDDYPKWMPFCTSAVSATRPVDGRMKCEVGFGIDGVPVLGTVGDVVTYQAIVLPPAKKSSLAGSEDLDIVSLRTARVVADTADGFAYGKRLVYDWRFAEMSDGSTDVRLDMFFQAKSVFYLPLWDSMQATITGVMMKKFIARAAELSGRSVEDIASSAAPPKCSMDDPVLVDLEPAVQQDHLRSERAPVRSR